MPLAPCLHEKGVSKERIEHFEKEIKKLVDKGMSEKEAGLQVIKDEHKRLHTDLNTLKKSIGVKTEKYSFKDNAKEITDNYEKLIEEKNKELSSSIEPEITEPIKPEEPEASSPPIEPPKEPPLNETTGKEPEKDKRRFTQQMLRDEDLTTESKAEIAKTLDYVVQKNDLSIAEAKSILDKLGDDAAQDLVINNGDIKPAVRVVLGQALIKRFNDLSIKAPDQATKDFYLDKTIQTAKFVTEKLATEPGQMIQAFSLYSRLSPEAQLRDAVNDGERISKEKKRRREKDVNNIGDKFKKVNEETVDEVLSQLENTEKFKEYIKGRVAEEYFKEGSNAKKAATNLRNIAKKIRDKGISSVLPDWAKADIPGGAKKSSIGGKVLDEAIAIALETIAKGIEASEKIAGLIKNSVKNIKEAGATVGEKEISDFLYSQFKTPTKVTDNVLKSINSELKEQGTTLDKIVKKHYTTVEKTKTSLVEKLVSEAGLEGAEAKTLADKIHATFDKIATKKKRDILYHEKARFEKIQKGLQGTKKVEPKTLQGEIIKYSNLGGFENAELMDMIADKLGLGKLTTEQAENISKLADRVEKAPEGSPKNDATEDLLAYRAKLQGHSWMEIGQAVWYAQILSGYKTHEKNIVSTFFNGMGEFAAQAAKNPKEIPFLIAGGVKGLKRGGLEAWHTMTTGRSPIHVKKIETPQLLERVRFAGGYLNPINYLKFVSRLMVGEDVLQFQGLKEMRATQLASREAAKLGYKDPFSKQTWAKVNELLLNTKERYDAALAQTKEEGITNNVEQKRRIYELMEESRPIEMTEDAYGFAAHGTFNHETEGTLGALTNAISKALDVPFGGAKPLRYIVPFTRIITNVVNSQLDYTPVGLLRAARGVRGFRSFEEYHITKGAFKELTKEQRQTLVAKASLGIGITAGLIALGGVDDKDGKPLVEITGSGTGDYKKDIQLQQSGWQPYSIKVGDTYYSYKLTPLFFMLGFVGNMNDAAKYGKDDEVTKLQRVELASKRLGQQIADQTWINSAGTLFGALSEGNFSGTEIQNALSQSAKGFLIPQLYTQLAQETENIYSMPQKQVNNMWQNMIQDIPIARNSLNDKINALGDPITRDVDVITSEETKDPVWKFLLDKKGWVAPVNKNSMIVFDGTTDRPATDDEYYEFSKKRGQKIKDQIKNLIGLGANIETETEDDITDTPKKANALNKSELQQLLKNFAAKATEETKKEMFNPSEKFKTRKTITINE